MENTANKIGFLESLKYAGDKAVLTGWAVDPSLRQPADLIIVKDGKGNIVTTAKATLERQDVCNFFERPELLKCGWRVEFPISDLSENTPLSAYILHENIEIKLEGGAVANKRYPELMSGFRLEDLISRGLKVGENFSMQPECFIDYSHCWLITIGNNVIFAPRVQLIAHDGSTRAFLNTVRIGTINIGDNVFLGNGVIVLPGVTIGDNCIVAAGSVVTKNVPSGSVYGGNPAKFICDTSSFIERNSSHGTKPVFGATFTIERGISEEMKQEMLNKITAAGGLGCIDLNKD